MGNVGLVLLARQRGRGAMDEGPAGQPGRLLCSRRAGGASGCAGVLGRSSGRGGPFPKKASELKQRGCPGSSGSPGVTARCSQAVSPELPDPTRSTCQALPIHGQWVKLPRPGLTPQSPQASPKAAPGRHDAVPVPKRSSTPNNCPKAQQHPLVPHREHSHPVSPHCPQQGTEPPAQDPIPCQDPISVLSCRTGSLSSSQYSRWFGSPIPLRTPHSSAGSPSQQRCWNGTSPPRMGHPAPVPAPAQFGTFQPSPGAGM